MKIVQVNVVYGTGSTGHIVECLHHQYESLGHESYVLFGRGPKSGDQRVKRMGYLWEAKLWRAISRLTGHPYTGSPLGTLRLKRAIKKIHPDIVHLHCINGNMCGIYSLLAWLRKKGYPTVITHHAMFLFTGGCGLVMCDGYQKGCIDCPHRKEFLGGILPNPGQCNYQRLTRLGLDQPWVHHAFVSPWLQSLAGNSTVTSKGNLSTVFNPVPRSVFLNEGPTDVTIRPPYVFFPTSLDGASVKGGQWIIPIAERLQAYGITVVTTGNNINEAQNVLSVGHIDDPQRMATLYRGALATLVLSSVESFSMPVIESLCCGTPVVAFRCGGPESIETMGCAKFVEYGDVDGLVREILKIKKEGLSVPSDEIAAIYAPERIAQQYIDIYNDLLGKA